jgi:DNA-binding NarL/FixJ family response regulator
VSRAARREDEVKIGKNGAARNQPTQSSALALLSQREAEIAMFVAAGLSNEQIARKASITEGTVKIHLHRAYQKLGIANRAGLVVFMFSSDAGAWGSHSARGVPTALTRKQKKKPRLLGRGGAILQ